MKIKSMIIIIASFIAMMLISANAEGSVTVVAGEYEENDNLLNITVIYTAPEEAEYITLLATKDKTISTDIVAADVVAIDQFENDGTGIAEFVVEKPDQATSYYVRMGGTDSIAANVLEIKYPTSSYRVTYYAKDETTIVDSANVEPGGKVSELPSAPAIEGFTFKGWYVGTTEFTKDTVINSDMTVKAVYVAEGAVMYGDVTSDGVVNRTDLLRLAKHFSGWTVEINESASDVNGDGSVNRADLLRLAKYFSGVQVILGE